MVLLLSFMNIVLMVMGADESTFSFAKSYEVVSGCSHFMLALIWYELMRLRTSSIKNMA